VNVASFWRADPAYEGLEKLYESFGARVSRSSASRATMFVAQEPGTADEIKTFADELQRDVPRRR